MTYNGTIYRPPVEANTFLLPLTEGCSHNHCSFCNMYQNIPFRMWSLDELDSYLEEVVNHYGPSVQGIDRVYLVGADPFALSAERLLERIQLISAYLSNVKAFTMYARVDNISAKSYQDLKKLAQAGVNDLYVGVECGLSDVLASLHKGYSAEDIQQQCLRLNQAGIDHCSLVMLGTAGQGRGMENAQATAALINAIQPKKILLNTMSAFVGTDLDLAIQDGRFQPASEKENLEEERALLKALELPDCYFWAVHPLDSVKLEGLLGECKTQMLAALDESILHVQEGIISRVSRQGTL